MPSLDDLHLARQVEARGGPVLTRHDIPGAASFVRAVQEPSVQEATIGVLRDDMLDRDRSLRLHVTYDIDTSILVTATNYEHEDADVDRLRLWLRVWLHAAESLGWGDQ